MQLIVKLLLYLLTLIEVGVDQVLLCAPNLALGFGPEVKQLK